MKGRNRLNRAADIAIGLGIVILLALMLLMCSWYMDSAWFYVSLESFQWMDLDLWSLVLTSLVSLMTLLWLILAFSFVAVVSAMCVLIAMVMMFAGFSLLWPLVLLLLAAWGVGQASQLD